jgi:hypothetical protein
MQKMKILRKIYQKLQINETFLLTGLILAHCNLVFAVFPKPINPTPVSVPASGLVPWLTACQAVHSSCFCHVAPVSAFYIWSLTVLQVELEQQLVDGEKQNMHNGSTQQPPLDTPPVNG